MKVLFDLITLPFSLFENPIYNYFIMFFVGYNGYISSKNKISFIRKIVLSIFFGFAIYSVLLFIQNFNIIISSGNRVAIDFWSKEKL